MAMDYSKRIIQSLATTAEVLVRGRGYRVKSVENKAVGVDVTATTPKSREKVLIRIITEPYLSSGRIGKQLAHEMNEQLEDKGYEKGVLIGESFTNTAMSGLEQKGVEFISKDGGGSNLMNPFKIYPRIQVSVDNLCKSICGKTPKSENECKGYNPKPGKCPTCKGTGTIKKRGRELTCPDCRGKAVEPKYTCDIRLISDNADFHFEKGWGTLLQRDLERLLRIQSRHMSKPELAKKILEVASEGTP